MALAALRSSRTAFLLAAVAAMPFALAACGKEETVSQTSLDEVAFDNGAPKDGRDSTVSERQSQADEDARAAEQARERRQQLADLEAEQKAETDKILEEGVPGGNPEDATIPLGSADPEVERFRSRLAGVCDGATQRITKVSKKADAATKSKDPVRILAVAQEYNDILNDFTGALDRIDPPPSVRSDYRAWQGTMNDLADNIREQLVSQGDAKKTAQLQREFQSLSAELVGQTASLGVVCLSSGLT